MQLAATQRPHPPPVPPRPSRQVVAEALKRSPRPPCPTRQAPPPPNTKPWRSDRERSNNRQQVCPAAGRTVVYESIKDSLSKETCNESSSDRDDPTRLVAKSRGGGGGGGGGGEPVPRAASERRADEDDRRGNPRERRHRITANSTESNAVTDPSDDPTVDDRLPIVENAISSTRDDDDVDDDDDDDDNGEDGNVAEDARCRASSESTIEKTEKKTQCATKKTDAPMRPMPTQRCSLFKYRDAAKKNADNRSCSENSCAKQPPVSDVDRATVVVIDESADRKATSNDEPDNRDVCDYHGDRRKDKDNENDNDNDNDRDNIHRQDWLEAGVHYSSTQIRLSGEDGDVIDGNRVNGLDRYPNEKFGDLNVPSIQERIAMSSLQGLPPLPRSLSGFNLSGGRGEGCEPPPPPTRSSSKTQRGGKTSIQSSSRPSPPARQLTTLDTQLAILRREMFGLRQLDLSLLAQLWSLNESIQEFRQLLQEQEDRAPSPSPSSEEGDDTSYGTHPPPPPRRPAPGVHLHRPPRPPRLPRPPPSDESPSSEEYGAV